MCTSCNGAFSPPVGCAGRFHAHKRIPIPGVLCIQERFWRPSTEESLENLSLMCQMCISNEQRFLVRNFLICCDC